MTEERATVTPLSLGMAHTVMVDALTAEVVTSLAGWGVRALVLKGPSLADWLYGEGSARTYGDSDILVSPGDRAAAEAVLRALGFEEQMTELQGDDVLLEWARPWRRGRGVVDLHVSYYGIGVDSGVAWRVLSSETETTVVARTTVEVLAPAARALLVALHAAHHGGRAARAMADLDRAIEIVDDGVWREALALSRQLRALGGLTAGLTMTPLGLALARRLGVGDHASSAALLRRTETGEGFGRLSAAPGLRAKARLLVREAFPSPAFLRWQTPLARRGRRGLAAAYVWRWMWLARRAPEGYRASRRLRRQ